MPYIINGTYCSLSVTIMSSVTSNMRCTFFLSGAYRPSLYCFLNFWFSTFVSAYWAICILHLTAVAIPGRSYWDTFLNHCMSWYTVFMMKKAYCVVIASFFLGTMIPRCRPTSVECLVLLYDRINGYDCLRNWEILQISAGSGGWLTVLLCL